MQSDFFSVPTAREIGCLSDVYPHQRLRRCSNWRLGVPPFACAQGVSGMTTLLVLRAAKAVLGKVGVPPPVAYPLLNRPWGDAGPR